MSRIARALLYVNRSVTRFWFFLQPVHNKVISGFQAHPSCQGTGGKVTSPQRGDLRVSGPPSGQGADGRPRTRDRRVPADQERIRYPRCHRRPSLSEKKGVFLSCDELIARTLSGLKVTQVTQSVTKTGNRLELEPTT
ncbi:hypothetical protein PoB_004816700 [Plakobranchus ocellatus]|uniref:Uncharacterized protein n=1 Tax=Plakobranchus ocellatus TaxID=259542 RepID=A0AAV4BRQ3_9GAST|nr:hypothetical protein PoB_004816700 [Plakobranchus ocellatus]